MSESEFDFGAEDVNRVIHNMNALLDQIVIDWEKVLENARNGNQTQFDHIVNEASSQSDIELTKQGLNVLRKYWGVKLLNDPE